MQISFFTYPKQLKSHHQIQLRAPPETGDAAAEKDCKQAKAL
jgi:hypothetical protein